MLLKLIDIQKFFGDREILSYLNLELEKGKIYSLMGANGAGKTTLFNILTGFFRAESGNVFFNEVVETINKAFKSLNKFHIQQNYEIGEIIVRNQEKYGW